MRLPWSLDGALLSTLTGHYEAITTLSFSPDSQLIASGSEDNTVRLWTRDGKHLRTLRGHSNAIDLINFSSDGATIVSTSYSEEPDPTTTIVKFWNRQGKLLKTLEERRDKQSTISFSAEEKPRNVVSTESHFTRFAEFKDAGFSIDGNVVNLVRYDRKSGYAVQGWKASGEKLNVRQGKGARDFSFSADGRAVALVTHKNYTLRLWGLDGTRLLGTVKGLTEPVNNSSFSPDGQRIVTTGDDSQVRLWDIKGKLLKTLAGHLDQVNAVIFSSDGKTIASASDDKTVKLWDADGTLRNTLPHSDKVDRVSFSPDGKTIATSSGGGIKLWYRDGTLYKTLEEPRNDLLRFSPDSQTLAIADGSGYSGSVTLNLFKSIWQPSTFNFSAGNRILDFDFSPDGKTIVIAGKNGISMLNLDLESTLKHACNQGREYLRQNPQVKPNDRTLCDDIP
jgi:WD40 repeat protein